MIREKRHRTSVKQTATDTQSHFLLGNIYTDCWDNLTSSSVITGLFVLPDDVSGIRALPIDHRRQGKRQDIMEDKKMKKTRGSLDGIVMFCFVF